MPKKLLISLSIAAVLLGALIFTVVLIRSRTLADTDPVATPQGTTDDPMSPTGTSTGGFGSGSSLGDTERKPGFTCGDGICSEGERSCSVDCGSDEERFQGSIRFKDVTRSSLTILWRTATPSTGEVSYGETEDLEVGTLRSDTAGTVHEVRIESLSPDRNYFFTIRATEEDGTVRTAGPHIIEASGI